MTRPTIARPLGPPTTRVPAGTTTPSGTAEPPARLHLASDARRDAALRLKSTRGHLDAIIRVLESENPYCIDVLQQLKAVTGALAKVNDNVLRSHVREHVTRPASPRDADALVDELMRALRYHHD